MMMVEKYVNEYGKCCYKGVLPDTEFSMLDFHEVDMSWSDGDMQWALHTNMGTFTVLDRMTGFGFRDIETGYRYDGKFWLASGGYDVRSSGVTTVQEALDWIKHVSNTCQGE